MENLSPLQQEVLEFLKQLADFCERADLQDDKVKEVKRLKYLKILVNDIDSYQALKKIEDLYDISAYLQREGLNFTTTADLVNQDDDPDPLYPGHFELGRIQSENIEEMRIKIKELVANLDSKTTIQKIEQEKPKIFLKDTTIIYNDNEAVLLIGSQKCQLPPYKNEHYFCRAMFEHMAREAIDWSIIYEKMTGTESQNKVKDKRKIYDAFEAINKRVKATADTDDDFFTFKENTITRNY